MKKNGKESENEKKWDDWRKWWNEIWIEERIDKWDWMRKWRLNENDIL